MDLDNACGGGGDALSVVVCGSIDRFPLMELLL
jgi:hypothetical protein